MAEDATAGHGGRKLTRGEREAHWRRVFNEQQASGLTHTEFCRRRSIARAPCVIG